MSALPPKADMDQHGRDVCCPKSGLVQRNKMNKMISGDRLSLI